MLELLLPPLAAALVILFMHAYLGLHVLARGVIFVDLAFAQIAALGATGGMLVGLEPGTPGSLTWAFGATFLGAILFSVSRMEESPVPQEAIIGITYVVASAAVLLLAGFTAEGAEHVSETLTGTLIWADWRKVMTLVLAYLVIGGFHWLFRRPLLQASFTPHPTNLRRRWDFLFYMSLGITISFSVEIAGVLMVFSALVIPGVIAFFFTNRFDRALVLAWAVGTAAIVAGIVASFVFDIATGPLLVCSFGMALVIAALLRLAFRVRPGGRIELPSSIGDPRGPLWNGEE
ncbi:MAG: metal ABC transporter permease [Gemmatimonadota bacterium]